MSLILDGSNGLSDVDGSAATPAIRGTDTNTGIFFPAADTIAFSEGGTEVARFNSAGNLGIGTTNPIGNLQVSDPTASELVLEATNAGGRQYLIQTGDTASGLAGSLRFFDNTASANRMSITSAGNIIFVDANNNNGAQFLRTKGLGTAGSAGFQLAFTTVNFTPASASSNIYWDGNTGLFTLSTSSRKYKRNIASVTDEQLDKALLLEPSYYQRLEYDYWEYGFIAEQVQEIGLDEFVTKTEGEVSGLNYEKMVTLAFGLIQRQEKAIQELKSELDTVKAELATLKAKS
jgi:hypothetical protein